MASLPSDPGPYWRVIFRKTIDGKRRSKTFYFKKSDYRKSEVTDWKKRKELAFKEGSWSPWGAAKPTGTVTLHQAEQLYLKRCKREFAPSTYASRKGHLKRLREYIGDMQLEHIPRQDVSQWVNSPSKLPTRRDRAKAVNVFFEWTRKTYGFGFQVEPVASRKEKQHYYNKQHKTFITLPQLETLIGGMRSDPRQRHDRQLLADFYRAAFLTTRRRGDLINLKGEWIFTDEPLLKIGDDDYLPKSQRIEYVPLIETAWKLLLKYSSAGRVFPFNGNFVTQHFNGLVKQVMPEMEGKLSLHNLRDSGIMYLIYEKELPLRNVMSMTGHSDLRSLQIYTHDHFRKTLEKLQSGG